MLAETEIAPSPWLPLEAPWAAVSSSWHPADASKYYRARYYDPKIGRFISEDPIGFAAGPNFYAYVRNNPARYIDPHGLDVAVIYGAPQGANRFGHIAIAVSGQGVYSSGTVHPYGSSATQYLRDQAEYRDSHVYILPTTAAQDAAVVDAFLGAAREGHSATKNNCADIVGRALKAGGLIDQNAITKLPGLLNSYMLGRLGDGGVISGYMSIPQGATEGWGVADQIMGPFNPR